jgi:hypothetical protein
MKHYVIGVLFLFAVTTVTSQNLVDSSSWQSGVMPPEGFEQMHAPEEDSFVTGLNPFGENDILWSGRNVINTERTPDGGLKTNFVSIDPNKTYRMSVWIKKSNIESGIVYFRPTVQTNSGTDGVLLLDGTVSTNVPWFHYTDLDAANVWYLFVAYMYPSTFTGTETSGAVYTVNSGTAPLKTLFKDYKFTADAASLSFSIFSYWAETNVETYLYAPRLEEVNGSEPTVTELLTVPEISNPTTPTASLWNTRGNDIFYDKGDVGIGAYNKTLSDGSNYLYNIYSFKYSEKSSDPSISYKIKYPESGENLYEFSADGESTSVEYNDHKGEPLLRLLSSPRSSNRSLVLPKTDMKLVIGAERSEEDYSLTVNGQIHSKEVHIDLLGALTPPDYVFYDDYQLKTLDQVQAYILKEGHLPNIPSAQEMKTKGIDVSQMHMKLLEKIEELTLYAIDQDSQLKEQRTINTTLKNTNADLAARLAKLEAFILKH